MEEDKSKDEIHKPKMVMDSVSECCGCHQYKGAIFIYLVFSFSSFCLFFCSKTKPQKSIVEEPK